MNAYVVAIHEAGHAASAHALGYGIVGVDFYECPAGSGQYAGGLAREYNQSLPSLSVDQMDCRRIESEIVVLMAGEVAQLVFNLPIEDIGVSDDRARVESLLRRHSDTRDSVAADTFESNSVDIKQILYARTTELIVQYRASIERLANEFIRRKPNGYLTGDQVIKYLGKPKAHKPQTSNEGATEKP